MTTKMNRQWRLATRPVGLIEESDFEWVQEPIPTPGEGQILIRNIYLSLDPTNRGWHRTFNKLFDGTNQGKLIIKVSENV